MNWNDIGDHEIARMLEELGELLVNPDDKVLIKVASIRLRTASDRRDNLLQLHWGSNESPYFDKYDGVLPGDLNTQTP
jgi:hypothetical protein